MSFASVNAADYTVETIRSVNFGRCYMICYAKEVKKNEKFILALTKKSDVTGKSNKFKRYKSKISNKFILSVTVVYSQFTLHTQYKLLKKVQNCCTFHHIQIQINYTIFMSPDILLKFFFF